jgi:hypothetical protein
VDGSVLGQHRRSVAMPAQALHRDLHLDCMGTLTTTHPDRTPARPLPVQRPPGALVSPDAALSSHRPSHSPHHPAESWPTLKPPGPHTPTHTARPNFTCGTASTLASPCGRRYPHGHALM